MLTDLLSYVSRAFTPPPKVPGRQTMVIPSIADLRDGRHSEKVRNQCRDCARLLAAQLYVWRKPFPEKATVKRWNKETMSFVGLNIEDFQNLLMANFTLQTGDRKEWLADKAIADRIWQSCTATDSPLPPASWQIETDLKPIFDSQRRFLLERCSPGAASRAIKVPGPQKCSAISLPKVFSILL